MQKKLVSLHETKIPWNINVGEQVICHATNVDIPRFFFSQHRKAQVDCFYNKKQLFTEVEVANSGYLPNCEAVR